MPRRQLLKGLLVYLLPAAALLAVVQVYWPRFAGWLESYWSGAVDDQGLPNPIPEKIAWSVFALALTVVFVQFVGGLYSPERARRRGRPEMPALLRDLIRYGLFVLSFAIVLKWIWGDEVAPIIGALGVGGIVLGFALQETLSNFFAGLALLAEKPFVHGDWIQIGERAEGQVEHITWRATKIRTRENDYEIFPNSMVAKEVIVNFRQPTLAHAVRLHVGTSYNDPPDEVKRTLMEVLSSVPEVLKEPPPQVLLKSYADFAINYEIKCFILDYDRRPAIEDRVMSRIWYTFRRRGIEIPFPIRTVYAHQMPAPVEAPKEQSGAQKLLASLAIFQVFSEDEITKLARRARVVVFGRDEQVIRQGESGDSLYGIISGSARVAVTVDGGTERKVATLGGGDVFGEMSLLTGEPRSANVYADDLLMVCRVSKDDLLPLLKANPGAAERIAEVVAGRRQEMDRVKAEASAERQPPPVQEQKGLVQRIRRFFGLG